MPVEVPTVPASPSVDPPSPALGSPDQGRIEHASTMLRAIEAQATSDLEAVKKAKVSGYLAFADRVAALVAIYAAERPHPH